MCHRYLGVVPKMGWAVSPGPVSTDFKGMIDAG